MIKLYSKKYTLLELSLEETTERVEKETTRRIETQNTIEHAQNLINNEGFSIERALSALGVLKKNVRIIQKDSVKHLLGNKYRISL